MAGPPAPFQCWRVCIPLLSSLTPTEVSATPVGLPAPARGFWSAPHCTRTRDVSWIFPPWWSQPHVLTLQCVFSARRFPFDSSPGSFAHQTYCLKLFRLVFRFQRLQCSASWSALQFIPPKMYSFSSARSPVCPSSAFHPTPSSPPQGIPSDARSHSWAKPWSFQAGRWCSRS